MVALAQRMPIATARYVSPRQLCWFLAVAVPIALGPLWVLAHAQVASPLGTFTGCVLVLLLLTSACTDLAWHRIPNWATYTAIAWGLAINAYASIHGYAAGSGASETWRQLGAVGIGNSLAGATALFFLLLVVFSFTGGGAGDVKLVAALGALLGLQNGIDAVVYSFVVAGGYVLMWAIWTAGPVAVGRTLLRAFASIFCPWISKPSGEQRRLLRQRIPLGPSFAIGTLMVLFDHSLADFGLVGLN